MPYKNREKYLQYSREYKKAHPEKVRAYYWRNRERILAKIRKGKKRKCQLCGKVFEATNNKARFCGSILERNSCSYQNVLLGMKLYKARKRNAKGSHTLQEWEGLKKKFNYRCANCGKQKLLTEDHIISLKKGGTNYIDNIQPLCQSCNSKKGIKNISFGLP